MSVNGITSGVSNSYPSTSFSRETASKTETKKTADTGVIYEPSTSGKDSSTKVTDYSSIVASMKKELSSKNEQLQNLVNKLLSNQAKKYISLSDMFKDKNINRIMFAAFGTGISLGAVLMDVPKFDYCEFIEYAHSNAQL